MIKYENSTLTIYIRNIKHYTDIDFTVNIIFPVNKIDRENRSCERKRSVREIYVSCVGNPVHAGDSRAKGEG